MRSLLSYLSSRPDDAFARIKLGEAFTVQRNMRRPSKRSPGRATCRGPTHPPRGLKLGFTYYNLVRYPEAFAALNKALQLDPGNLDAMLYRGMVYFDEGDIQRARSYFEKVLFSA
jgi:tetratricopeptide (TPR) repeat protein